MWKHLNFALEKLIKNKIQEATSKQQLVFAWAQNPWIVSWVPYRCQVIYNYIAFLKSSFSRVEDYSSSSIEKKW